MILPFVLAAKSMRNKLMDFVALLETSGFFHSQLLHLTKLLIRFIGKFGLMPLLQHPPEERSNHQESQSS